MAKKHAVVSISVFLLLAMFILVSLAALTGGAEQAPADAAPGYAELAGFDFEDKLALIDNTGFLYYREAFYAPEDFAAGRVDTEPVALDAGRVDPGHYGTYRMIVHLPKGFQAYGLSADSAMYAQRLFIDGREYPAVGRPGAAPETTASKTNHYTVYFTPETDEVEIIIQFANFVHYDYGGITPLYLGTQQAISARDGAAGLRVHMMAGCAMAAFLFFIGMFLFFRGRYAFLWFSLACLSIGIRMLIVEEKSIMLLFPNLPWQTSISLEYLALILLILSFIQYLNSFFTGALSKPVLRGYEGLCGLYALIILLTNTTVFTRFMLWFQLCSAAVGVYVFTALLWNVARKRDNRHMEHYFILLAAMVFAVMTILDIFVHRAGAPGFPMGLSEIAMILIMLMNMIALVLQFAHTEQELDKARRNEREAQQANLMLDRLSRMKSEFLTNVSHEMRTPLTVMSSYAGLTAIEIRHDAVSEKTLDNLAVVKREAIRLAELVEQFKELSLEKERELTLADVNALSILQQAVSFCEPICQEKKNRLIVSPDPMDLRIHVHSESIFQTLVNLIINANRHTQSGSIRLSVAQADDAGFALLSITDTGEGIAPERLGGLFIRGVSGDGSSGLGLAICKEIVEEHGGRIWIESAPGKGTTVSCTLPMDKGAEK